MTELEKNKNGQVIIPNKQGSDAPSRTYDSEYIEKRSPVEPVRDTLPPPTPPNTDKK